QNPLNNGTPFQAQRQCQCSLYCSTYKIPPFVHATLASKKRINGNAYSNSPRPTRNTCPPTFTSILPFISEARNNRSEGRFISYPCSTRTFISLEPKYLYLTK